MQLTDLNPGDIVYASTPIHNDGTVPELPDDALLASAGTRGVLLNTGHLEEQPHELVFLVRFEQADTTLGPPVGCWEDELTITGPDSAAGA